MIAPACPALTTVIRWLSASIRTSRNVMNRSPIARWQKSRLSRSIERLNRDFCHRAIGERFITFLLVLIEADSHRITVVSAGHAGAIIRRRDGSLEVVGGWPDQSGQPLGINVEMVYSSSSAL